MPHEKHGSYLRLMCRTPPRHSLCTLLLCLLACYQQDFSACISGKSSALLNFHQLLCSVLAAGLRQMPEAERLSTLRLLDSNRAEVEAKIATLPIIIETPSMVNTEHVL